MERVNGNGAANTPAIQINPADVARMSLEFMQRITLTPAERQRFGLCESFLEAIALGRLVLGTPPPPDVRAPDAASDAPSAAVQ